MSKYPPEALEPENLAECIDDNAKKISQLENLVVNDEHVGIYGLDVRLSKLESSTIVTTWIRELTSRVEGLGKSNGGIKEDLLFLNNRIDELEKHLKVVAEIHLRSIEENTEQIGMIIRLLEKPRKLSTWLAKMGL